MMSVCLASALTVLVSLPKTRGETRAFQSYHRPEEPGAACFGEQLITEQSSGLEFGSQDTSNPGALHTPGPQLPGHGHMVIRAC